METTSPVQSCFPSHKLALQNSKCLLQAICEQETLLLKYFRNASIWKCVWRPLPLLVWTRQHSSKWDLQMLPHNYTALTSSLEEYHPPACVGYFWSSLGKTSTSDFKLYFPVSLTASHFREIWQNVVGQNVLMVFKSRAWHRCKQNFIKYFKLNWMTDLVKAPQ